MVDLAARDLPEWLVFHEASERVQAVKARLHGLEQAIPDADEKQRQKLLAEQRELVIESQSLPGVVAEAARRYCLAHLGWLEGCYFELDAKLAELTPQLEAARARCLAFQKKQREVGLENLHNVARLTPDAERELMQRRAAHDVRALEIGRAWRAEGKQANALEAECTQTTYHRNAMRDRARLVYGVQNLLNHSDWQRCSYFFGEMQRRQADGELHASLAGPVGVRPLVPRRGGLPSA